MPIGYSGQAALRREQCDMMIEQFNKRRRPLLDNGSINMQHGNKYACAIRGGIGKFPDYIKKEMLA
jgi:hypothetical protein